MMFIELTVRYSDGCKTMINVNHIVSLAPCGDGCVVALPKSEVDVAESYNEVARKLSVLGERMGDMPWLKREVRNG